MESSSPQVERRSSDLPVRETSFVNSESATSSEYASVLRVRDDLVRLINLPGCQERIAQANVPKASSSVVQDAILDEARSLGFRSEKTGLFKGYRTPGMRPDYYLPLASTGILLEVERGKTTINNMDLLDFWKCHLCAEADYLFLMVPQILAQNDSGRVTKPYTYVVNRIHSFFTPYGQATQVRGVTVFGY